MPKGRKPSTTTTTTAKKKATQSSTAPLKAQLKLARDKWRTTNKNLMDARVQFKSTLAAKSAEFSDRVKKAEAAAYDKALAAFEGEHAKKDAAKQRVIAAAEARFEKAYAKVIAKKASPKKRKTATRAKATTAKTTTAKRGRPAKKK